MPAVKMLEITQKQAKLKTKIDFFLEIFFVAFFCDVFRESNELNENRTKSGELTRGLRGLAEFYQAPQLANLRHYVNCAIFAW